MSLCWKFLKLVVSCKNRSVLIMVVMRIIVAVGEARASREEREGLVGGGEGAQEAPCARVEPEHPNVS